jgi:hypothetical protein
MIDSTEIDFEGQMDEALVILRGLWKGTSDPKVRESLNSVAKTLELVAGDRDYLLSVMKADEEVEWRETILSY